MSFREYKKSLSCLSNRIVFQINKSSHHRTAVNNSLTVKVTVSCCLKQRLNLHSDRNFNCNILINVTADCYILLSNRLTVCNFQLGCPPGGIPPGMDADKKAAPRRGR